MPDTCTISRTAPGTINPDGSQEPGTTTTVTYICRVAASGGSPQETLIASRLTDTTPFTFVLPDSADVTERDMIVYAGASYQVLGVLDPVSYSTSIKVVTKRIT
jgi:SPP1 family predicted phage head-tail adaptor